MHKFKSLLPKLFGLPPKDTKAWDFGWAQGFTRVVIFSVTIWIGVWGSKKIYNYI